MAVAKLHPISFTPKSEECKDASKIIQATHKSCSSFLTAYDSAKAAKGAPTDTQQDQLRAMLVFASSGLDAMMKQLVSDALPRIIHHHEGAFQQFVGFTEKQFSKDLKETAKLLARAITQDNPRNTMIGNLVSHLKSDSLQSKDQIFQVASFFDIPSDSIHPKPNELKEVFAVRNLIIHEMDVNLQGQNRKRHPRQRGVVVGQTNVLLGVATRFLSEVDKRCS